MLKPLPSFLVLETKQDIQALLDYLVRAYETTPNWKRLDVTWALVVLNYLVHPKKKETAN